MEENKDYRAYRYGDHLEPGAELKIEHSVSCEDVDISSLITMGAENLEAMRQGSIDGEQKAYEIVVAAAKQWEKQAAATQMINRALSYLRTPEVTHTANEWRKTGNWRNDEEISNRVYRMSCGIWEDTKYDRETKQSVPVAWYVTWDVYVNSPKQGYGEKIAGQNQKRYTDKAAAEKYLEGRKKAYSHLFTEISPQIPKQYEHHFTVYELIQMILEKNNMHDFDTFNIFKWIFKTFVATYLLTNCFTIVMAVFDVAQNVVSQSAGVINGNMDVTAALADLETQLEAMGMWELIGLWLETNIINLCMWVLSIVIFVIVYGRMIEIYLTVSLAPIPFSTMANREWGQMGTNYLRSLFALGFQGFLILVCVAIYAVLVQSIPSSGDIHGAIWGTAGYTVLLAFALFKTGSLSKSIFNSH